MKKYIAALIGLLLISVPAVMGQAASPRISPMWTVMVESPYTFDVWAQNAEVYDVQVLLVVTEACYNGMPNSPADAVIVDSVTALTKDDFTPVTLNSADVPPGAVAPYQAAALKDHLDYELGYDLASTDTIYWALSEPVFDPLTGTVEELEITLNSEDPRMTIYLIGNLEDNSGALDTRTPPTNPGFMVPEITIGSIMAVSTMFVALGLYAYKKKGSNAK